MKVQATIMVSRQIWEWAQEFDEDFRNDLWRIIRLKRLFTKTKQRAVVFVLLPVIMAFTTLPTFAERGYDWAPWALIALLVTATLSTHRFGSRLRSIAWESRRIFRRRMAVWQVAEPGLNELLARERASERTLEVQVPLPVD